MDISPSNPAAEVMRWDEEAVRVYSPCGNGRMVWRGWGEGRPIVLLHGGSGSWRHWIRNLSSLTREHRVWAADLPGLGESDLPELPWSLGAVAEIVATGVRQLLGPDESCDLVGFSFGALVSAATAARLADRVGTLVLVGASGLGVPRGDVTLEKVRSKTGEARVAAHRANLERLMIADPSLVDAQALAIQEWNTVHARIKSVGLSPSTALLDALADTRCALAAIWGGEDAVARLNLAERVAALSRLRPDAEVRIIPAAGHWVAYEAADAFNTALAAILGGERTRRSHG